MLAQRAVQWPWDAFAALPITVQLILISAMALIVVAVIVLWRIGDLR